MGRTRKVRPERRTIILVWKPEEEILSILFRPEGNIFSRMRKYAAREKEEGLLVWATKMFQAVAVEAVHNSAKPVARWEVSDPLSRDANRLYGLYSVMECPRFVTCDEQEAIRGCVLVQFVARRAHGEESGSASSSEERISPRGLRIRFQDGETWNLN